MKHMDDLQTDGYVTKKYKYAVNTWIINDNNHVANISDGDDHNDGGNYHCNGQQCWW